MNPQQPIGIFDSGVGGLTVAEAVTRLLPHENVIYFGDTAHTPWGDKSAAAIQSYSRRICDVLLKYHCKVILIACNTASSAAYEAVKEYVGTKALILDVIEPTINYIKENHAHKKLGLIGTRQTVNSNVYKKKLETSIPGIQLQALATPLLVPLIEEGFANKKVAADILNEYLSQSQLQNIEALILACTHYPIIKHHIQAFYQNNVAILDSSDITAHALKLLLEQHHLLNHATAIQKHFYVSDFTPTAAALTKVFFHETVRLEQYPLWE